MSATKISWDELVTMLSINLDAATRDDIAEMATQLSELMDLRTYLSELVRKIDALSDDDSKTNWDFYSCVMALMQRTKQLYRFVNGGNVLDGETWQGRAE